MADGILAAIDETLEWYGSDDSAEWRNPDAFPDLSPRQAAVAARLSADTGTHPLGDSRLTRFIAANDPAHVLRQAAAIRRILARHHARADGMCAAHPYIRAEACPEKRDLAAIWATHPDYKAGWKP